LDGVRRRELLADFLKTAAFIVIFMFLVKYAEARMPDGATRRAVGALVH
jgi:hypothetical protein